MPAKIERPPTCVLAADRIDSRTWRSWFAMPSRAVLSVAPDVAWMTRLRAWVRRSTTVVDARSAACSHSDARSALRPSCAERRSSARLPMLASALERRCGYTGYGAPNAPFRIAAQKRPHLTNDVAA